MQTQLHYVGGKSHVVDQRRAQIGQVARFQIVAELEYMGRNQEIQDGVAEEF